MVFVLSLCFLLLSFYYFNFRLIVRKSVFIELFVPVIQQNTEARLCEIALRPKDGLTQPILLLYVYRFGIRP